MPVTFPHIDAQADFTVISFAPENLAATRRSIAGTYILRTLMTAEDERGNGRLYAGLEARWGDNHGYAWRIDQYIATLNSLACLVGKSNVVFSTVPATPGEAL